MSRINDILDCRWLSNNGPQVQEFEAKVAQILDVKYAIAMCNATVALEIASRAIGLQGEVILPSYTFVATAHAAVAGSRQFSVMSIRRRTISIRRALNVSSHQGRVEL